MCALYIPWARGLNRADPCSYACVQLRLSKRHAYEQMQLAEKRVQRALDNQDPDACFLVRAGLTLRCAPDSPALQPSLIVLFKLVKVQDDRNARVFWPTVFRNKNKPDWLTVHPCLVLNVARSPTCRGLGPSQAIRALNALLEQEGTPSSHRRKLHLSHTKLHQRVGAHDKAGRSYIKALEHDPANRHHRKTPALPSNPNHAGTHRSVVSE